MKAETQGSNGQSSADSVVLKAETGAAGGEIAYHPDDTAKAVSVSPISVSGTTLIHGTADNDTITGSSGNDIIYGHSGNDKIYGGLGSDRLVGGEGKDIFVFDAADLSDGHTDTVADFNSGLDKLDFSGMKDLFSDGRELDFNWAEVLVDRLQADTGRAYLVFDDAAQTLAYQPKGLDTANVFLRFEGDVHLGADQIV